ncbi:MAG: VWA domain-containing protein [Pseudomonadota bacterium]|nr:VWA domain-containing protein [Pseudomonadota bacterium]
MTHDNHTIYLALLDPLFQCDAELGEKLLQKLNCCQSPPGTAAIERLVVVAESWFKRHVEVAQLLIDGCCVLLPQVDDRGLENYVAAVDAAGVITSVLARSAAEKFVAICAAGEPLLYDYSCRLFHDLGPWGPYPLGQVTNGLLALLEVDGAVVATTYAKMIVAALKQGIEEKKLIRLVEHLVTGIKVMADSKRVWQTGQLLRVVDLDWQLGRSFLRGLERGLRFLKEPHLTSFVDAALKGDDQGERRSRFLGLEAISGRELYRQMQTMATLSSQLVSLQRYLQARGGRALAVRPLSEIPRSPLVSEVVCCTDGRKIFLPAEMELGKDTEENKNFYRLFAGLELAAIEAQSFAFDFGRWQRLWGRLPEIGADAAAAVTATPSATAAFAFSDYYAFFALFPKPELAEKLFNLAEFARLRYFLELYYPGFARRIKVVNGDLAAVAPQAPAGECLARYLYRSLVLGEKVKPDSALLAPNLLALADELMAAAVPLQNAEATVAEVADWVANVYDRVADSLAADEGFTVFRFPFGRRLRFDLVYLAYQENEKKAHVWREELAEKGVGVDKSELKDILRDQSLQLTPELLRQLLERSGKLRDRSGKQMLKLPPGFDLSDLLPKGAAAGAVLDQDEQVPTFWYDEWDYRLNDYLRNHVKLLEHRRVGGDDAFYQEAIADHGGLIRRIRRNFELIRPEAIQILRHWPEGDAFDYDALLEYAIDRKMRVTPDERLYRKRLKVDRDVALFVLVDLSSSTRKAVLDGGGKSILAVEKEALVLFCEALERVGDAYALAGFSGSGRLAAEFFYLKTFAEPLNDEVKGRIGGVRPEKNTRMGPAIRHAAKELKEYPARVKLMIILSDGLPNDQDYSNEYAIADSRSAIRESRSSFIHVHAITINAVNSPHLDNLYGDVHHTVIADVKQLPDKLPRIYRALTRQ